eukprot:jgi/Tetstr1/447404/TSEL_034840.t1
MDEVMRGALDSLSTEFATAESKAAALIAELRACDRTHLATEEATRSQLDYLQLAKNGPKATEADRGFAELAYAKFCTPRRIAVSGQLDQLRRAFDDKTLDISLSAAGKAPAAAAFAKATTPDNNPPPPSPPRGASNARKPQQRGRPQRRPQQPTRPKPRSTSDGVARRADSCTPTALNLRHRVRRWGDSESIGASGPVLSLIRQGIRISFKNGQRPRPYNHGVCMRDATQAQLDFMATELLQFKAIGAWERGRCDKWVSRIFLVPKPGTNKWRLIIDLRELNKWCKALNMSYESLTHLRHLAQATESFRWSLPMTTTPSGFGRRTVTSSP